MHLFVDAIVRICYGGKIWVRGVAGGLLGVSPLAVYVCQSLRQTRRFREGTDLHLSWLRLC